MNNKEAIQKAFEAFMANDEKFPDGCNMTERVFNAGYQAALASQAQQPTAYRVIASANGEVVRDSLEFTRMSELDEKVVRKSCDLEIVPLYAAMQSQAQQPAFPPRDLTKPAEQQGMFSKFHVERVDGSSAKGGKHHGCRYWVLDLDHDKHAPAAMRGYAEDCKETHPILSAEIFAEFGMQSQAQQESKQGCKECDGQTYIHSPTGEYLGECQFCTKEEEPYAYDVPTKDGTELAYAIYFTKYNNPLPEGAIPLYASQQESQLPDISALKRIAKELKTYIPEADEYKGKFIHKVWAKEIESALPPAPEGDKDE
ncbi:hypothetical protein [Undibacterium baiyunense]|uniref:Uncharacterized protein n=1 Tax=Undibacterium baiyunense TaxID=2828731 RepID=A0A941DJN3_9BURK|nr:hypothetical protein [Undibacterium baiyunense]MBR7747417.1 hypothetical protein [Undibacterium baiyunense]